MLAVGSGHRLPFTRAVRQALQGVNDSAVEDDLLFLEAWEIHPSSNLGAALRVTQIKRANPGLAAAIHAELKAFSASATPGKS